ncbi:MAG: T9SS C-terminal target domain-containing protein [Ignavibacteriae bacterium]|nr:MAG: T9SS C-terminal target domain-containing protein [Ignavibacteriota bacterium]
MRSRINIKIIIYCLLIFICSTNTQWIQQNSGTSTHLTEIRFINQNTGWACGINGLILKTTNGGTNWVQQFTDIYNKPFWRIRPVDENIVYCVGSFETFLKTTNGGVNWQIIKNGPLGQGHSYYALHFINQNTGWYSGTDQLIFKTTNGGNTIDSFYEYGNYLRDIYFKNEFNGVTCGDGGVVLKTTNGGTNWYQIYVPLGSESADFLDFSFIGDNGWIVGRTNNKVYKTTNFGTNWDSTVRIITTPSIHSQSIFFSNINTGWVACSGFGSGIIFKTTNGSNNWIQQFTPDTIPFGSIFFVTDNIGWCAGNYGTILHTTTGGQYVGISNSGNEAVENYKLYSNYPNPFNPKTTIKYDIQKNSNVTLVVYDLLGRELTRLVNNEFKNAGRYEINWNATNYASGVYIYKIKAGDYISTKKMVLVK